MALVKCPECGNEVSDKAVSCPKCGYPLKTVTKGKKWWENVLKIEPTTWKDIILVGVILLGLSLLLYVLFSFMPKL